MDHKQMTDLIEKKIIPILKKTREAGQREYAHNTGNVFANFERIAEATKTTRESVLLVYLLKHMDGITEYVNGFTSQREDVTGRITDAIVYLMLLWGMNET